MFLIVPANPQSGEPVEAAPTQPQFAPSEPVPMNPAPSFYQQTPTQQGMVRITLNLTFTIR